MDLYLFRTSPFYRGDKMPSGIYDRSKCQRMTKEQQEQQNEFKTFWNKYFQELEFYPEGVSCGCGCKGKIIVRLSHKYHGIPKYLPSHQSIGKHHSEEWNRNIGDGNRGQIRGPDPEETKKNKRIAANRPDVIAKNRADAIKQFQDPKQREKQQVASIKLWQDPEYVSKQMKARSIRPNKGEIFLDKLLQKLYPNEYKYVGDGQFILAGKCPDFINVNGQKKIIELFGEHVHKPKEEQERIDLFAKYGYQTLVIWYRELANIEAVEKKLFEFTI